VVSRFDGGANHKHQTKGNHDVTNDDIIDQTRTALVDWSSLAKEYGVRTSNIRLITERMADVLE